MKLITWIYFEIICLMWNKKNTFDLIIKTYTRIILHLRFLFWPNFLSVRSLLRSSFLDQTFPPYVYFAMYDYLFLVNYFIFFGFHSQQFRNHRTAGEGISLTPPYHFHPLHRHLDISRAITTDGSSLHIGSSWTRSGNL